MKAGKCTFLAASLILTLSACAQEPDPVPETETPMIEGYATIHEQEFGGVYIEITIDDFNRLGFVYGDSVDVVFSNGYTLEDIPYYNGYYVDAGKPLLIAYPGYDYIKAAVNYGDDLWETAGLRADRELNLWMKASLDEHSTASIYLNEHGKYADIQEARDIHYTDLRTDYPSDEVFANFRMIRMGDLAEGMLYRSASPCDNQHKRAPYVDRLIREAGVNAILDLADTDVKIERYITADDFDSPYFLSLYEQSNVLPIGLNMNYYSEEFAEMVADGLIRLTETEPPYLIHCTEGKDRTGFVCMLVEALAGASYEEIVDDYMLTYANYYKITETSEPSKYRTILEKNLDDMIRSVVNDDDVDITAADLSVYACSYLNRAGMNDEQIDAFLSRITE